MAGPGALRGLVTAAFAALILAPAFAPSGWDDFPVSTYPMFSRGNLGAEAELDHVLVTREDGTTSPAPPEALGTPEVMVAMKVVAGAVARGEAGALCARTLAAVRARDRGSSNRGAISASIVTSRFATRRYFTTGAESALLSRTVHARCEGEAAP